MTVNRVDQLGPGLVNGVGVPAGQSPSWQGYASGETPLDPVEAYFECITTCSLDDGDCVTTCTEILREHS